MRAIELLDERDDTTMSISSPQQLLLLRFVIYDFISFSNLYNIANTKIQSFLLLI